MNTLSLRRRWLIARPWIQDCLLGACFIVGPIAFMYLLGYLGDLCIRSGWCA